MPFCLLPLGKYEHRISGFHINQAYFFLYLIILLPFLVTVRYANSIVFTGICHLISEGLFIYILVIPSVKVHSFLSSSGSPPPQCVGCSPKRVNIFVLHSPESPGKAVTRQMGEASPLPALPPSPAVHHLHCFYNTLPFYRFLLKQVRDEKKKKTHEK